MYEIKDCNSDLDILDTFWVISQLRPHLQPTEFLTTIRRMKETQQFHLVSIADSSSTVRAVMGMRLKESLACGKYLYIDDLITDESSRSNGYGKKLLDWAYAFGKANECKELHLDSGVQRHSAHRFYLRERMDIICYHFAKFI